MRESSHLCITALTVVMFQVFDVTAGEPPCVHEGTKVNTAGLPLSASHVFNIKWRASCKIKTTRPHLTTWLTVQQAARSQHDNSWRRSVEPTTTAVEKIITSIVNYRFILLVFILVLYLMTFHDTFC